MLPLEWSVCLGLVLFPSTPWGLSLRLPVTGRLSVARVDLVLHLLEGEALRLAWPSTTRTYDELLHDGLRALRLRALEREHGLRTLIGQ